MDNKKNVRFSGMGIYMIIVIIAAMFIMYVARMNTGTSNYTYNELVNDISKGKIESVSIRQNAEVPTGVVTVKVSGEQSVKSVYVSDVKDVEELLLDKNIEYTLKDVARQSVMLTTILPFGLSLLVIVFIMMMFTRQAGGGGNAKMMNFGKSRARMISSADNKVTFKDVAGLQEEKEDQQDHVINGGQGVVQPRLAVVADVHRIAVQLQQVLEGGGQADLILYHQYAHEITSVCRIARRFCRQRHTGVQCRPKNTTDFSNTHLSDK